MGGLPGCRGGGVAAAREGFGFARPWCGKGLCGNLWRRRGTGRASGGGLVGCCRAVSWGKRVRFVIRTGAEGGFGGVLSSGMIIPRGTLARTLPQRARARSPHTIVAGPFSLLPSFCCPPCGLPRKTGHSLDLEWPCKANTSHASPDCNHAAGCSYAPSAASGAQSDCSHAAGCGSRLREPHRVRDRVKASPLGAYHAACESKAHAVILRSHAPLRLAHRLPLDIERLLTGFQAFGFEGIDYGSAAAAAFLHNFRSSAGMDNSHAS